MSSQSITVKYLILDPTSVNLPDFIPLFHRWIQTNSVDGLLIDVVDYKHVHEGPGVILIGHDVDYAIDLSDGKVGLLYRRKRLVNTNGPLREQLHDIFRSVLRAGAALETEKALHSKVKLRTDQVEITFPDRLRTPNTPEAFDQLSGDIKAVVNNLYRDHTTKFERAAIDSRQPLTILIDAPDAPDLSTLLARAESISNSSNGTPANGRDV